MQVSAKTQQAARFFRRPRPGRACARALRVRTGGAAARNRR